MKEFDYKVDDVILVFKGYSKASRETGVVRKVISPAKVLIESTFMSDTFECEVKTSELCLISPYREGMHALILNCLWHPIEVVDGCRKNIWWSQKAEAQQVPDQLTTWNDYQRFLASLKNNQLAEFEKRAGPLCDAIDDIPNDELGKWWLENWREYVFTGASECQKLTIAAIKQGANYQADSDPTSDKVNEWIQNGINLCKRCDPDLMEKELP